MSATPVPPRLGEVVYLRCRFVGLDATHQLSPLTLAAVQLVNRAGEPLDGTTHYVPPASMISRSAAASLSREAKTEG